MTANNELILLGGGGHCRSCIDVIEKQGDWKIGGIIDVAERIGERVFEYEIVGTDQDVEKFVRRGAAFLVTIGQIKSSERRVALYNRVRAAGGRLASVISPQAYVSPRATVGSGTVVMHRAVVNCGAVVGDNVIVNSMALIEHDAQIGNHCHISTAALVNGGASVGDRVFIGSNAVLHHGAKVPDDGIIPAGSVYRAHA